MHLPCITFNIKPRHLCRSWLDDEEHRCFDILAVYYGSDRAFACPQCIAVFQERAVKWQALHRLYLSDLWSKVKDKYKAFMLPDDDLIMSTHGEQEGGLVVGVWGKGCEGRSRAATFARRNVGFMCLALYFGHFVLPAAKC